MHIYIYPCMYTYIYYIEGVTRGRRYCHAGLHVEYAKRRIEYGILFIFSLCREYIHLEYIRIHGIHRVDQVEYVIYIFVVAPQEYVNIYSTRRHAGGGGAAVAGDGWRWRGETGGVRGGGGRVGGEVQIQMMLSLPLRNT